ncbi:MAG: ACT domain-containing protein [Roseibacillus sp.]
MDHSLVMTVLGPDRPGLLANLSETIYSHGGSWFESRLARFAGQFAGILRFDCPDEKHDELLEALTQLENLNVQIVKEVNVPHRIVKRLNFDVHGHHHPGIVRGISSVIARIGGNLEELSTERDAAPQPGHILFRTIGKVAVMEGVDSAQLESMLQALGSDITVSVEQLPATSAMVA